MTESLPAGRQALAPMAILSQSLMSNLVQTLRDKMSLSEIFSKSYLFAATAPQKNDLFLYEVILFGLLVVVAIVYLLLRKMDSKIRYRHFYNFLTIGVLGYVYLFARYEGLPWLGSRLFLALILLALIVWSLINTIWLFKYNKKLEDKKILADRYEKYLPKPKNH